jgi:DNA-binding transcriptional LysR family regulator
VKAPTLNTTRLRIIREVAARGTIAAAAEALYMTAPAASHQLAVLEREVGVPLLDRTARSVRLTDAGVRLVEHAEVILAECESALADVAAFSAEVAGTVRLSTFQTAAQTIALPAIVTLRERFPSLHVTAVEFEPVRAIPALNSGQLDIALSHDWDFVPPEKQPGLDRYELLTEPIVVILPREHRLAESDVRLTDLADERWCLAQQSSVSRQAVERAAYAAGFRPNVVLESNYFRALGSAVEAGLGVSVAPAMTDFRGLDIRARPLIDPVMNRRIFAAVRKGAGVAPVVRAVVRALLEAGAKAQAHTPTAP